MRPAERKNQQKDLFEMLPKAITALKKNIIEPFFGEVNAGKYDENKPPLRSEIFTEEQLEQHAKGGSAFTCLPVVDRTPQNIYLALLGPEQAGHYPQQYRLAAA